MTAQNLIELVIEESQGIDPSIAELYIGDALRELCERTLLLRKKTTFTTLTQTFSHDISSISDLINIRDINKAGVYLKNTRSLDRLLKDEGYWFIDDSVTPTLELGWWDGTVKQSFSASEVFEILYEAYALPFAKDNAGDTDYTLAPGIPERFHIALTYRANEKASRTDPEMRRYWHALWRDQLIEAKKYAHTARERGEWNINGYLL